MSKYNYYTFFNYNVIYIALIFVLFTYTLNKFLFNLKNIKLKKKYNNLIEFGCNYKKNKNQIISQTKHIFIAFLSFDIELILIILVVPYYFYSIIYIYFFVIDILLLSFIFEICSNLLYFYKLN